MQGSQGVKRERVRAKVAGCEESGRERVRAGIAGCEEGGITKRERAASKASYRSTVTDSRFFFDIVPVWTPDCCLGD